MEQLNLEKRIMEGLVDLQFISNTSLLLARACTIAIVPQAFEMLCFMKKHFSSGETLPIELFSVFEFRG